jgi:hypothetical protein
MFAELYLVRLGAEELDATDKFYYDGLGRKRVRGLWKLMETLEGGKTSAAIGKFGRCLIQLPTFGAPGIRQPTNHIFF